MPKRLSVEEAAKVMGVTPMFLRMGLRQDKFSFGAAVQMRKQWAYFINPQQFTEYMGREGGIKNVGTL